MFLTFLSAFNFAANLNALERIRLEEKCCRRESLKRAQLFRRRLDTVGNDTQKRVDKSRAEEKSNAESCRSARIGRHRGEPFENAERKDAARIVRPIKRPLCGSQ